MKFHPVVSCEQLSPAKGKPPVTFILACVDVVCRALAANESFVLCRGRYVFMCGQLSFPIGHIVLELQCVSCGLSHVARAVTNAYFGFSHDRSYDIFSSEVTSDLHSSILI